MESDETRCQVMSATRPENCSFVNEDLECLGCGRKMGCINYIRKNGFPTYCPKVDGQDHWEKVFRPEEEPDICEGCGLSGQTPMHKSICRGHGEQFDETKLT